MANVSATRAPHRADRLRVRRILVVALVALAAFTSERGPAHAAQRVPFEFREGVIADPGAGIVYVMNDRNGIDALDVTTGRPDWTTTQAQKPLCLVNRVLVAQVETGKRQGHLRLALLDTQKRGALRARPDIELPTDVAALIDQGPGTRFEVHTRQARGGLMVDWTFTVRPIQATRIDPPPAERRWSGGAFVAIPSGKVIPLATDEEQEKSPAWLKALRQSEALPGPLWNCGETWISAGRVSGGDRAGFIIERWRSSNGTPLPKLELSAEAGFTVRYPSADGRHLLVSRLVRGDHAIEAPRYQWLVFSLATQRPVARFDLDIPAAWFFIAGPLLVYEVQAVARREKDSVVMEPRKLRAVDLRSGTGRWSASIRNTSYQGLLPPGGPGGPVDPAGGMPDRPGP
jgi:hypothetical protein